MTHNPAKHLFLYLSCAILAIVSGGVAFWRDAPTVAINKFEPAILRDSWEGYQRNFMVAGRVCRPKNNNDTVSEGQAYAMLRSVWMRDKNVFDACYRWTEKNLSRSTRTGDHLLAWNYGRRPDGTFGVLDWNAASDADLDYALALLLAASCWGETAPADLPDYRNKALLVIADIRKHEVISLQNGEHLLLPWPVQSSAAFPYEVNPSYFSPGHYHLFAEVTGDLFWSGLADSTYGQLERLMTRLGSLEGCGLVPDWCMVDRTGAFTPSASRGTASSWDAFRIWWRLRIDYNITNSIDARRMLLTRLVPFLQKHEQNGRPRLDVECDYTGNILKSNEASGIGGIYAWSLYGLAPKYAQAIHLRMNAFYLPGKSAYGDEKDYYGNSWAWFAEAIGAYHFPFSLSHKKLEGVR